eukprot:COSAG01_NODE_1164_length_11447_cov_19.221096_6_plen_77_part_00
MVEHLMLGLKVLLDKAIPPEPNWLAQMRERRELYLEYQQEERERPTKTTQNPLSRAGDLFANTVAAIASASKSSEY